MYNAVNWLTMGAADAVSGAIAPEEPLSLQHWMDSYATVMLGYGAWKSGKSTVGKTNTVKTLDSMDESSYSVVKNMSAEEVNKNFIEIDGYQPPYLPNTEVYQIKLLQTKTFVRVYDKVNSKMYGGWMMELDDIIGLTNKEIQNKFALPFEPQYICDVVIPKGTIIRVGYANGLFGFNGGGTQYDLMGQIVGEFSNERLIGGK